MAVRVTAFCYQAEVTDISGTKYFPAVKEALAKAEKSIYVVMFTIEKPLEGKNSKVAQLIEELVQAKNRGVDVDVILDQNVNFVHRKHPSDWDIEIKSTRAYKLLKDAGIKVYYDEPVRYAHAKTVVIDKKIVILGSTNWTESSFDKSIETNLLVNSTGLAEEILAYLKTIKIDDNAEKNLEIIGPSTLIRWDFLEDPDLAPQMIKAHDERAFDVYLYLLWKLADKPEAKLTLSYDYIAKYLGIYDGWTATDYRRQIIKVLKKLDEKYKLIRFEPNFAKEAVVTLLDYENHQEVYEIPQEKAFEFPNAYFDFGWNRELSHSAKFCLFINAAYFDISDVKPFWSESSDTLTKQFGGISRYVLTEGMEELRRKKLIEVKYDELGGKPFDVKAPKTYRFLKLYDPKDLEKRLKEIEEKHSKKAYAKARRYAEIVFEENNPEVIEDIILRTDKYGEKKVNKAFDIVARKKVDNPKRSYAYAVGIMEK
ncbi:MAG: phospholipase D-like domain-containing protein [Candidatus Omnitrophica bacterium]|nr:phospholipase D-like domain-containing protein [Candidatus Omnitrophota bacterium]